MFVRGRPLQGTIVPLGATSFGVDSEKSVSSRTVVETKQIYQETQTSNSPQSP